MEVSSRRLKKTASCLRPEKKSDYNYGMECWSNGIVEYWVSLLHHSNSEFATHYEQEDLSCTAAKRWSKFSSGRGLTASFPLREPSGRRCGKHSPSSGSRGSIGRGISIVAMKRQRSPWLQATQKSPANPRRFYCMPQQDP